jgi:hypothetical protein
LLAFFPSLILVILSHLISAISSGFEHIILQLLSSGVGRRITWMIYEQWMKLAPDHCIIIKNLLSDIK